MTQQAELIITPPGETRSGLWEITSPAGGFLAFDSADFVLCALAPDDDE